MSNIAVLLQRFLGTEYQLTSNITNKRKNYEKDDDDCCHDGSYTECKRTEVYS